MKIPLLDSLPPNRRRWLLWSAGLLFFYTVFGFLILPPIVRAVATKQISRELGREVSIARVRLNPYTFSATVRGLLIKDKDGQPFVSWGEVYANFQWVSFLGRPWVFREIRVSQPFVRVQINRDYSLNCSDLIGKYSQTGTNAPSPSKPLALCIHQLHIAGARASLSDLTPRTPFTRVVGPLEVTLNQFHTDPAHPNSYSFSGTSDAGERFAWNGHFFLNPIRSSGEFSLENLALNKFAPLYQDFVRLVIGNGTVDLRGAYRFVDGVSNRVALVTNFSFTLRSLKLAEPAATNSFAELDLVSITGASVDALAHRARIASIAARGGRLFLRRNADASVNVLEALNPRDDATIAPGSVRFLLHSVTNLIAQILATTNAWQGTLNTLNVDDHALRLEDLVHSRPAQLILDAISFHATNLSNLPGQTLTTAASARWNSNGTLAAASEMTLLPLRARVSLDLDGLDLAPVDPYLEPFADVLIRSGAVSVHGTADVTRAGHGLPEVRFRGAVAVEDLATHDGTFGDELLKWKSLRISGIDARLEPPGASVTEVALIEPRARLIINTNRHINLLSAARMEALNPLLRDTNAPPPEKKPRKTAATATAPSPPTNAPSLPQWPKISIATVALTNADIQFTDRSLKPLVNFGFTQFNGTITGLSTEKLRRADVHLAGRVENTALAEITGRISPFNGKEATDLTVSIKEIDLHPTGPYSGKFLGYRLSKGKLSLDLKYQVSEGKLKASNRILVDQLTLGEKTGSPDATKLPVRLALAVLTDRNGRIELDVPIAGTLDDPEFKLGKVISHAILNIITKVVTSPFAALGAVFGGKGEEIRFQEFAAGATDLQPAAIEKLDTLVKGLYERPGLQLEIEGSIDPISDRAALARQKIQNDLRAKKWKALRKAEQGRTTPAQIPILPEEYQDAVKELHAAAFAPEAIAARAARTPNASTNAAAAANIPSPTAPRSAALASRPAEKGASALLRESVSPVKLAPEDREGQLLGTIEVTGSDYTALAAARARRVKEYILQTGRVESDRLFLPENAAEGSATNGSRVYLHLR